MDRRKFLGKCGIGSFLAFGGALPLRGESQSDTSQEFISKVNHYVSVSDFGAKGDGVTDDTAALKAAHAASLHVYYPKPKISYVVQTSDSDPNMHVVVPYKNFKYCLIPLRSGARIWGEGSKIFCNANQGNSVTEGSLFYIEDQNDIEIDGLIFDSNTSFIAYAKQPQLYGFSYYIAMASTINGATHNISIRNCSFYRPFRTAIASLLKKKEEETRTIRFVTISNCGFFHTGAHGVAFAYGENCLVTQCEGFDIGNIIFKDAHARPGLLVDFSGGCNNCVASDNIVEYCRNGFKSSTNPDGKTGIPSRIIFSNNIVKELKSDGTNGYGIQVEGSQCVVDGNIIDLGMEQKASGILVQTHCYETMIVGNSIRNVSESGIKVQGAGISSSRRIVISDNVVLAPIGVLVISNGAENLSCGITISGNSISSTERGISSNSGLQAISGNTINMVGKMGYAIYLGTTSNSGRNVLINDNMIYSDENSNCAVGLYFASGAELTNIVGNKIFGNFKCGIRILRVARDTIIQANNIQLNELPEKIDQECIYIESSENISITNNILITNGGGVNSYCIRGPMDHGRIVGNSCRTEFARAAIFISGKTDSLIMMSNHLSHTILYEKGAAENRFENGNIVL